MKLLHNLPIYHELCAQYNDDLLGFIHALKGIEIQPTHREIAFLCAVKMPGSRLKDELMHSYGPIVALWFFLFRPESIFLFIAPEKRNIKIFLKEFKLLLGDIKHQKFAWIVDEIVIKDNLILMKDYRTWSINLKVGKQRPTHLAGCFASDFMVWLDEHKNIDSHTIDIAHAALTQRSHRAVMA